MTTLSHITLSDFESLMQIARLPSETRITVTVKDDRASLELRLMISQRFTLPRLKTCITSFFHVWENIAVSPPKPL